MKIFVNGQSGRLNTVLIAEAKKQNIPVCTGGVNPRENPRPGLSEADIAIDFSFHTATLPLVQLACELNKPVVIATTGHTDEERQIIKSYAKQIPLLWAGNYATGVNVFFYAIKKIAERLGTHFDAEIIEAHHAFKKDSPGGTAVHLIELLQEAYNWAPEDTSVMHGRHGIVGPRKNKEIGVHAIRAGGIIGEHTVLFSSPHERIEITQRSHSRESFVQGALMGAKWLLKQPIGLYNMEDVLGLK